MHKKILSLAILAACLIFQSGCINISDEAMASFGAAITQGIGEIVKDVHTLSFASSWFYQVNGAWPSDFTELKEFIEDRDAPLNLDRYEDVQFETKEDGSLECTYSMADPERNHTGTFVLNAEDVKEMNVDTIDFGDGHFHIEPPRNEEHIQSENEEVDIDNDRGCPRCRRNIRTAHCHWS